VWWDQALSAGEAFDRVTEKALDDARAVVVLWSRKSVESRWVRAEATQGHNNNRLVPAMIEACRRPMLFELTHTPDLSGWKGDAADARWRSFVGDLRRFLGQSGPPAVADSPIDVVEAVPEPPKHKRLLITGIVAGLLLVAALLGLLAMRTWRHAPTAAALGGATAPAAAPPLRIAVLPFEDLSSDASLQRFSRGLVSEMIGQLNRSLVPVVSGTGGAAASGGLDAAYAFTGTVDRSRAEILARVRLDDVRLNTTAWSSEYRTADSEVKNLQNQIAMEAASVAGAALGAARVARGDTEAVNLMIQSSVYAFRNRPDELDANWQVGKRLVEKFPEVAEAHANFAIVTAFLAAHSPPERAAVLRSRAKEEIEHALRLNPNNLPAQAARAALVPAVGHWGEREGFLLDGIKRMAYPLLTTWQSNLLREVGRLDDALDYGRQAQAPKPGSQGRDATLLLALASRGRMNEAMPLEDQLGRDWPTQSAVWNARLHALLFAAQWDTALGLFANGAFRPIEVDDATIGAWRSALVAMKSGNATARRNAAHGMLRIIGPDHDPVSTLPHVVYDQGNAIAMLAMLGDVDAAFEQARRYLLRDSYANSSFLFWPTLAAFRADHRFMKLAADIGLIDYWRSSGKWPDFCEEPGRPYDCKAVAATVGP
jgi:TolB-like protein